MSLPGVSLFIAFLALWPGPGRAGAPPVDLSTFACADDNGRPVPTVFNPSARYFAEAHRAAPGQGPSPYVIWINREVYFLGIQTQRWLHQRQCVRIGNPRLFPLTERGDPPLNDSQERRLDCDAIRLSSTQAGVSARVLMTSIESDIERLTKDRWGQVLPGPQRRLNINLANCGS